MKNISKKEHDEFYIEGAIEGIQMEPVNATWRKDEEFDVQTQHVLTPNVFIFVS